MKRMRTIAQTVAYLREADPETAVSERFLRCKVVDGTIPHIDAGREYLISIEDVEAFLAGQLQPPAPKLGEIRPVRRRS